MNVVFRMISILLLIGVFGSPEVRASSVEEILKSNSARELSQTVLKVTSNQRRARGCEIQRREGVAPTLCYPSKDHERLDAECVRSSRTATRVPIADEFTSAVCRDAIERREKDLAYAANRDALR